MLHVHKEYTDKLDLTAVTNDFVSHSEHSYIINFFGKFWLLAMILIGAILSEPHHVGSTVKSVLLASYFTVYG